METWGYKWRGSELRVSCGVPGKGMMAYLHTRLAAQWCIWLVTWQSLSSTPFKYQACLWAMLSISWGLPTSHEWRHGHWEGETDILTWLVPWVFFLHWAPQLRSWGSLQYCLVNQFTNRAAARGYPGWSSRICFFFSFYRPFSRWSPDNWLKQMKPLNLPL